METRQRNQAHWYYPFAGLLIGVFSLVIAGGSALAAEGSAQKDNPNPNPILVGHVIWQEITQGNNRSILPITLTLKMDDLEVDYPEQDTDVSGFFTVSVAGLSNGTYQWRVRGPGSGCCFYRPSFLANSGTVVLAGDPQTNMDNNDYNHRPACRPAGCIRGGDANHDDRVNVIDFSILKTLFGQAGYVVADFDNNQVVNVTDFHVILTNFGQTGAPPVGVVGW